MLLAPRLKMTWELDRCQQKAWLRGRRRFDGVAFCIHRPSHVESPEDPRDVDEQRVMCDVHAWAVAASGSKCEMITEVWVGLVHGFCFCQLVVEISSGVKAFWIFPPLFVEMNGPFARSVSMFISSRASYTHHQLRTITAPFGIKYPLYQSSWVVA